MRVQCNGITVNLSDKDFITEGGEGKIYGKNDTIYKIYTDKKKVINPQKIVELSVLDRENIVKPMELVYIAGPEFVGFTMKWIKNTVPLVKLFSNAYKDTNGVSMEQLLKLIDNIKENINYIHSKNILIVDGNEFNYLVDEATLSIPYFIDVDSYQTKNFPATAIMPSIVDYKSKGNFTDLSDWFSFAIVSFQILTGIHPFKGTHPAYSKKDLEGRMKANISVFNKQVLMPPTAKSLDVIPTELKDWYYRLFEKGERIMPPFKYGGVVPIIISAQSIDISLKFDINLVLDFENEIRGHQYLLNNNIFQFDDCIFINKRRYEAPVKKYKYMLNDNFEPIFVYTENKFLKIHSDKQKIQAPVLYSENSFIIENKLFNIYEDKVTEVDRITMNDRTIFSVKNSWNILANATKVFDGFLFSNLLGKYYLNIPYDFTKTKMSIKHIPELEGYRIIDGKRIKNIIVLVGHKDNQYDKIMLKFDNTFENYVCSMFSDTQDIEINFSILENGIGIFLNEENLYIMSVSLKTNEFNIIKDINFIKRNPIIGNSGSTASFYSGKRFYEFKVKQK